jgi:SAM-dependent methyltransferase
LNNVTLMHHDLMQPLQIGDFDVVLCLGVLHHTADMTRVLRNLSNALRAGGGIYLWMYGKHGRYRHCLNRRLLRMLVDRDDPDAVELARRFAVEMGDGAPLAELSGEYTQKSWKQLMLGNDAWVADQFLHPHEQVVDIESLAALAASAGLELNEWLGVRPAFDAAPSALRERFAQLNQTEQWLATDLWLKPESYLVQLTRP